MDKQMASGCLGVYGVAHAGRQDVGRRRTIKTCCAQFGTGGVGYGLLELVWRGYTHISMILVGGLCLLLLVRLAQSNHNFILLAAAGGGCITAVEFAAGCVLNLWLGLDVWDYSEELFHVWGQICPRFTILWSLLCLVLIPLCRFVQQFMLFKRCKSM